jgi:NhaP-type Na+/H+ or K+/H+ antiporter
MEQDIIMKLGGVIFVGVMTVWIAWKLKLPSILLLIITGVLVGPIFGWVQTDQLFGDLLHPFISLSVAVILFEGGLNLNMAELKRIGKVVQSLLTFGVLISWILITIAAHYILGFQWMLATLIGSMLVVTGPTVIMPLMRQIRPTGTIASVLRWEGIVIDPIGVMLAVLVYEVILIKNPLQVPLLTVLTVFKTAVYGGALGYVSSWLMIKLFKKGMVPQYLQNAFTLAVVIFIFALSNHLQDESGLLAVTVMGVMLASQKEVPIEHIVEFKENLQVLLIPAVFIVLASKIDIEELKFVNWRTVQFIAVLVLFVRPVSVFISTMETGLKWRERLFLSWMAPRGIIAAAMASVFAIELKHFGYEGIEPLVPTVFFVIISTVAIYGLTAGPLAYLLKLADPNPQGILLVGGDTWPRRLAKILTDLGIKTLIIDTNAEHVMAAEQEGLTALNLNILAEHAADSIELSGIRRLLAVTPNEEVNSMAAMRFVPSFGKKDVFQLSSEHKRSYRKKEVSAEIRGRILFSSGMTYQYFQDQIDHGAQIKSRVLQSNDVNPTETTIALNIPLLLVTESKSVRVFAADNSLEPKAGDQLIYLETVEVV